MIKLCDGATTIHTMKTVIILTLEIGPGGEQGCLQTVLAYAYSQKWQQTVQR